MNFFSRLFGAKNDQLVQPNLRFGRYTDTYKEDHKYDSWDEAVSHFEAKRFFDSYVAFFEYLRDDEAKNVMIHRDEDQVRFTFYQGSKKITGWATQEKLKAESKIATATKLNIGFLRRLVESNYNLKYGRYCIDDDGDISMVFDTLSLDASPYKIYYALKEIALASDKQDDLLVEEFDSLQDVNVDHVTHLPPEEKQIKADYLHSSIEQTLHEIEHGRLNRVQYPGGITYLLLELIYRLDFLVRPEGNTMEAFERMHRTYFAADNKSAREKNRSLIRELRKVLERSNEKLAQELYDTVSTFGITNPSTHVRLSEFIKGELGNIDWYQENDHEQIALAITGYIAGYSLFYYSMAKPDRELFLLYFQIMHQNYFASLGFTRSLVDTSGQLNASEIRKAMSEILDRHSNVFVQLRSSNIKEVRFDNRVNFARSYMQYIASLDLTKPS